MEVTERAGAATALALEVTESLSNRLKFCHLLAALSAGLGTVLVVGVIMMVLLVVGGE